ncbi:MAG: Brp/Blh family beta-carotene 15,15'-dioxygenase [Bacteroidota bacterium]
MERKMTFRNPKINLLIITATLAVVLLSQIDYSVSEKIQYFLLIAGTIVIGIPHGATDNHIFRKTRLSRSFLGSQKQHFYIIYLLISAFYTGLWLLSPAVSLVVFLFISVYHFGQSHLFYLQNKISFSLRVFFYILWGSYVLFIPLMYSYHEAMPVLKQILGYTPVNLQTIESIRNPVALGLFAINFLVFLIMGLNRFLPIKNFLLEILNLVVLGILGYLTPLFVAFITYWALWHSFNSLVEISTFITNQKNAIQFKTFYRKALPLTLITFAGIGILFFITQSFGSKEQLLAVFFIIIAAITLPHTILMDFLYREKT